MTYRNKKWENRIGTLGDPAESAFEDWASISDYGFVRYGLNRPPIDMRMVPEKIRYTPDYLTNFGLVEVQGCGRDQLFKFKHEKLVALQSWNNDCPVSLWLYDQPADKGYLISLNLAIEACMNDSNEFRRDGLFDGYKPYSHFDTEVAWNLSLVLKAV